MRRSAPALAASPVLVGAVTVLVTIVAVFLSYNANTGLPFVPTYDLKANLPNASQLVEGFEVRIGGARVGQVSAIEPQQREDGSTYAQITMKLDKEIEPLPADSALLVRPRSALGLKYVELRPGSGRAGFRNGATIPISQARPEVVEIDDLFNMFDEKARAGSRNSLDGYGEGLAGRGQDLNLALAELRPLLEDLEPVARNLADPETRLDRFFRELGDAAAEAAPVAETQADLFANLDTTFTALSSVARPYLQETISEGPLTEAVGIRDFPRQRPFLRNNAALFRELRPGVARLPALAPVLADAFEAGTEVLPKTPPVNEQLADVFEELAEFSGDPVVRQGIDQLTRLSSSLRPTLDFVTPAQTVCNYATLFFRNVCEPALGWGQQRHLAAFPDRRQAGRAQQRDRSLVGAGRTARPRDNHLHTNPYPNTASPGQTRECEAGNEPLCRRPDDYRQRARQPGHADPGAARGRRRWPVRRGRHGGRLTAYQVGLIGLVLVVVLGYLAFSKDLPFTRPFEISAVFENAPPVRQGTVVRVAGVDVGKVSAVESIGGDSPGVRVTMEVEDEALPIHKNAEIKARQRIFLEGNLFMEVRPGTPDAGELEDGDSIPASQTSAAVQIDQVLGTLTTGTREDLQRLLEGYGEGLNGQPQPGEDDDQDADVQGETGGQALNDSLDYSADALRGTAVVNDALLGTELRDLSKLVAGQQKFTRALASREQQLKELITNFNVTMGALASEEVNLQATLRELPEVLEAARPALDNLNRAFPSTRAWALEMIPGVRETPATIDAGFPWLRQARALVSPAELQGLVERPPARGRRLRAVRRRPGRPAAGVRRLQPLPVRGGAAQRGDRDRGRRAQHRAAELSGVLPGPPGVRRRRAELHRQRRVHPLPARRGRVPGADRIGGRRRPALRQRHGAAARHPPCAGREAPLQAEGRVPAAAGARPERGQDRTGTVRRQISKQARVFVAVIFLVVIALGIGGYILSNQRFYLPPWVPVLGTDFYEVEAQLSTAQAVVPGQGQTVNVAGVKVGEVGEVNLEDGTGVVTMRIRDEYRPIYRDATILLRPKTGLKDMILSLDPGTPQAGPVEEGGRVRVSNTLPDVNADEVLGTLDGDTRAYLRILLNDGGRALADDGAEGSQSAPADLRETFKRFEPTARDAKRLTGLLAERRRNIRRSIHSFQQLATELGSKDEQLASLVDGANANFEAFAQEEASLRRGAAALPRDPVADRHDAARRGRAGGRAGSDARGPSPVRARACPRASRSAALLHRDHPDHPRSDPALRPGRAAGRTRSAGRDRGAGAGHAAADEELQGPRTRSSTRWPTTRPAPTGTRTCSGAPGRRTTARC